MKHAEETSLRACPSCGIKGHRTQAYYCLACGRKLEETPYRPADALRASYCMQQNRPAVFGQQESMTNSRRTAVQKESIANRNGASATALAFATYALVPYLGILFCPGAVVMGGLGLIRAVRVPHLGGRNASYAGIGFGIVIFSAQIFLWWILYKAPQWATGKAF